MNRPKYKLIPFKTLKKEISEILSNYDEILLAYVYGSYAKGLQDEFSDIDVGILLEKNKISGFDTLALAVLIDKKFEHETNTELRILNGATVTKNLDISAHDTLGP